MPHHTQGASKPGRWTTHATGEAVCSKLDNFCRETGRRLAMRRAYIDLRVKAKRTGYKWDENCSMRKIGMGLVDAYLTRPTGVTAAAAQEGCVDWQPRENRPGPSASASSGYSA